MITVGTPAPDLDLIDTSGERLRLLDAVGERGLVVFFMRTTTCPICNAHVRELVARADEFAERGIAVLVVVPEGRVEAARWASRRGIPLTVVTGGSASAHEQVGLTRRVFGSMQQSGTLLLDAAGVVRYAQSSTLPTGSYDRDAVVRAVDDLVGAGERPASGQPV